MWVIISGMHGEDEYCAVHFTCWIPISGVKSSHKYEKQAKYFVKDMLNLFIYRYERIAMIMKH